MEPQLFDSDTLRIVQRAQQIFLSDGYGAVTMTALADGCGLTRHGLYRHFASKEDILRAVMRLGNAEASKDSDWAVQNMLAKGGTALDVIAEWLDARFGNARRTSARTEHGEELNDIAFRVGSDIMIQILQECNGRLAIIIADLQARGMLTLKAGVTPEELGQLIADGARGVDLQRPPVPVGQLAPRYRRIAAAILYGCAEYRRAR